MESQYTNKVVLSTGEILIDLTADDVKEENVDSGIIFHDATGARKTGTSKKTVDASGVTATAAEVLIGRTFAKGEDVLTGTMPDRGSVSGTIKTKEGAYTIPQGHHDGGGKVSIDPTEQAKIIPGNIKEGVVLLGVHGEYGADDISSQEKEVTPSFVDQAVTPDAGYAFLTGVTVRAIPVVRQNNAQGGVTITIG